MSKDLRKVIFRLGDYEFDPDLKEQEKIEDLCKERHGYFHRWIDEIDNSEELPCVKALALIESDEDGKIYPVEYRHLRFVEDWE